MFRFLFLFCLSFLPLFGQKQFLTLTIKEEYRQLCTDGGGNLYLINAMEGRIMKLYAPTYDSVQYVGGRGSFKEGFIRIADISAQNRQEIYVLDEDKRRVSLLNTNLKVVNDFYLINQKNESELSGFLASSLDVSTIGDMYLLNIWDNKVYKINKSGNWEESFGGNDYGDGSLISPNLVRVSRENKVYVGDSSEQIVSIFDLYGIYQEKWALPFHWTSFCLSGYHIWFWDRHHLYQYDTRLRKVVYEREFEEQSIYSISIYENKLYVLGDQGLWGYSWEKE